MHLCVCGGGAEKGTNSTLAEWIYLETVRFRSVFLMPPPSVSRTTSALDFHSRVPPVVTARPMGHTRVREREDASVLLYANGTKPSHSVTEGGIVLEFCSGMSYNYSVLSHRPPLR